MLRPKKRKLMAEIQKKDAKPKTSLQKEKRNV